MTTIAMFPMIIPTAHLAAMDPNLSFFDGLVALVATLVVVYAILKYASRGNR